MTIPEVQSLVNQFGAGGHHEHHDDIVEALQTFDDNVVEVVFDYLKTSAGDLNPDIQTAWDNNDFGLGDVVGVFSYYENGTEGGGVYRYNASGTGTPDTGSFIDFTGFQLERLFNNDYYPEAFGARGNAQFIAGPEATQVWTGTDNTQALQDLIDFAPAYSTIDFHGKGYLTDGLTINKPLTLKNGHLIANLTATGYLLTGTSAGASVGLWDSYLESVNLENFRLDGNARRADIGGLDAIALQSFNWRNLEILSFAREGLRAQDGSRNAEINGLEVSFCGDSSYAALDFQNRTANPGHQGLTLRDISTSYNAGVGLRIGSDDQGSQSENINLDSPKLSGVKAGAPATITAANGVSYATAQFQNQIQLQIVNSKAVKIDGGSLEDNGTSALIEILDNLSGDGVPGSPDNTLTLSRVELVAPNASPKILNIDGTVSSLIFSGNNASGVASLAQLLNYPGNIPNDAIKSTGNSWDSDSEDAIRRGSIVAATASSFYDTRYKNLVGDLPCRNQTGRVATRNGGVALDHDGRDYVWLPAGTASSNRVQKDVVVPTDDVEIWWHGRLDGVDNNQEIVGWHASLGGLSVYLDSSLQMRVAVAGTSTGLAFLNFGPHGLVANQDIYLRCRRIRSSGSTTIEKSDDGLTWTQIGSAQIYAPGESLKGAGVAHDAYIGWMALGVQRTYPSRTYEVRWGDIGIPTDIFLGSDDDFLVTREAADVYKTVLVQGGPVDLLDGVDDWWDLDAADTPTFTVTNGAETRVLCFESYNADNSEVLYHAAQDSADDGHMLYLQTGDFVQQIDGSNSIANQDGAAVSSQGPVVGAGVIDNGTAFGWDSIGGVGETADITGLGTFTYETPRIGARAYAGVTLSNIGIFSVLSFDRALTVSELSDLSAFLLANRNDSAVAANYDHRTIGSGPATLVGQTLQINIGETKSASSGDVVLLEGTGTLVLPKTSQNFASVVTVINKDYQNPNDWGAVNATINAAGTSVIGNQNSQSATGTLNLDSSVSGIVLSAEAGFNTDWVVSPLSGSGLGGLAGYTVTNSQTDRAFDANTVTLAELADVLGTVIADLS